MPRTVRNIRHQSSASPLSATGILPACKRGATGDEFPESPARPSASNWNSGRSSRSQTVCGILFGLPLVRPMLRGSGNSPGDCLPKNPMRSSCARASLHNDADPIRLSGKTAAPYSFRCAALTTLASGSPARAANPLNMTIRFPRMNRSSSVCGTPLPPGPLGRRRPFLITTLIPARTRRPSTLGSPRDTGDYPTVVAVKASPNSRSSLTRTSQHTCTS